MEGMVLTLALSYGGREELLEAARRIARLAAAGQLDPARLTEQQLEAQLWTADLPPVDLVIRTSGEQRLSNFLLWQSAYAELVFTPCLWPDFRAPSLPGERGRVPTARATLRPDVGPARTHRSCPWPRRERRNVEEQEPGGARHRRLHRAAGGALPLLDGRRLDRGDARGGGRRLLQRVLRDGLPREALPPGLDGDGGGRTGLDLPAHRSRSGPGRPPSGASRPS